MNNQIQEKDSPRIDVYSIIKYIKKYSVLIFMSSVIIGIWTYIFCSEYFPAPYEAGLYLTVVPQDNTVSLLSENNMSQAVERGLSVLNSDVLENQVLEELGRKSKKLPGKFTAERIAGSNMIHLKVRAAAAVNTFHMLSASMKNYSELSSHLIGGYTLKPMGEISPLQIKQASRGPSFFGLLASLGTILAGVGIAVLLNLLDGRLHNEEQAKEELDANYLGSLSFEKKHKRQKAILVNDPLVSVSYLEEMEKISTKITNGLKRKKGKSLIVTSLMENEGKSTVTANLALALARRGKIVLLLEGDMRRPALAKIMDKNMEQEKELQDYLEGKKALKDFLSRDRENSYCYCFSRGGDQSGEVLRDGENLEKILKAAASCMDYILIDTPPAGLFGDAELIGSMVDGALVVVKQDGPKVQQVNDMIDRLNEAGGNVIGCVFNQVRKKRQAIYAGYRSYGYKRKADVRG